MKRAEVLRLAEKCVCGGRDSDYGTPEDNFSTIAKLWTIYRGTMFTAKDVAMMMALLKIARIRNGRYSADSYLPNCNGLRPEIGDAPARLEGI